MKKYFKHRVWVFDWDKHPELLRLLRVEQWGNKGPLYPWVSVEVAMNCETAHAKIYQIYYE